MQGKGQNCLSAILPPSNSQPQSNHEKNIKPTKLKDIFLNQNSWPLFFRSVKVMGKKESEKILQIGRN